MQQWNPMCRCSIEKCCGIAAKEGEAETCRQFTRMSRKKTPDSVRAAGWRRVIRFWSVPNDLCKVHPV